MEEPTTNQTSLISDDELFEVYPTFHPPNSMPGTHSDKKESKPTPYISRTSNVSAGSKVESLKAALGLDLKGRTLIELGFEDFVKDFMKCDQDTISKILSRDWELDSESVSAFATCLATGAEKGLHAPFLSITQDLLQKVIAAIGAPKSVKGAKVIDKTRPHIVSINGKEVDLSKIFHDTKGSTQYKYYGTTVKPDFLTHRPMADDEARNFDHEAIERRNLLLATRPGEFKKKNKGDTRVRPSKKIKTATTSQLPTVEEGKPLASHSRIIDPDEFSGGTENPFGTIEPVSGSKAGPSFSSASSGSSLHTVRPTFATSSMGGSSSKRKRDTSDVQGADDAVDADETAQEMLLAEAAATADLPVEHCQLGVYAMACLSTGARVYVTGIFVDGFKINMFYYDRRLVLRAASFDFRENPKYLALLVYAMLNSDYRNDGLNIYLHKQACTDAACNGCIGSSMQDACFRFPLDESSKVVGFENGKEVLKEPILPTDNSKLFAVFDIGHLIHEAIGLVSRATIVYEVTPKAIPCADPKGVVGSGALKMSWQPDYRCVEMELVAHLLQKAPACQEYLPEIMYGGVFSAEALGLPSAMTSIPVERLDDFVKRALHVVVSKLYHSIWTVKTPEEFLKIWTDCIKCHYIAWKDGGVLHRDLSENNLMFKLKETRSGASRVVSGVLNDWDMASKLDEQGHPETTTAKHRTGTLPFMSPELLGDNPSIHFYRHDLESFVFVLLHAMVRYDLEKGIKAKLPVDLEDWATSNMRRAQYFKNSLRVDGQGHLSKHIRTEWQPLFKSVGKPLLKLISKACFKRGEAILDEDETFDFETCGGHFTYETFMAAISSKPT